MRGRGRGWVRVRVRVRVRPRGRWVAKGGRRRRRSWRGKAHAAAIGVCGGGPSPPSPSSLPLPLNFPLPPHRFLSRGRPRRRERKRHAARPEVGGGQGGRLGPTPKAGKHGLFLGAPPCSGLLLLFADPLLEEGLELLQLVLLLVLGALCAKGEEEGRGGSGQREEGHKGGGGKRPMSTNGALGVEGGEGVRFLAFSSMAALVPVSSDLSSRISTRS